MGIFVIWVLFSFCNWIGFTFIFELRVDISLWGFNLGESYDLGCILFFIYASFLLEDCD